MFLGIDQALGSTGVALVSQDGHPGQLAVIRPSARAGAPRLASIRDQLRELTQKQVVQLAAIEGYSYGSTGRAFELGEVGGVVRVLLHDLAIPFIVVAPAQLKLAITGNPQASKAQMRETTKMRWHLDIDQDDACDAHGLAQVARVYATGDSPDRPMLEVARRIREASEPTCSSSTGRRRRGV